jgi:hypothetical protein
VINAETSGGEAEREFIQTPDTVLARGEYDLIIASPSLATGVSIEAQGRIYKVYGIFTGVSSTDADIAQSLARVREPVERVVWVANKGRNWSKVGRSTNALAIKTALMEQTSASISLIRPSLKEDSISSVEQVNWQADPHLNLYCRLAAEQNYAMIHLRDAVLVRLKHEGHQITVEEQDYDAVARYLYRQAATEQKRMDAEAIAKTTTLTYSEVKLLEQKESRTPEEERAIQRFYLCEFYALDPETLTPEFILWDADGRRRGELLNLEAMLHPEIATDSTVRALEKQSSWNQGICPWDISGASLRRELRKILGLNQFLDPDREWVAADTAGVAELARQHTSQIQAVLHFTPSDKLSDVQITHQLLSQLGLKVTFRWSGSGKAKHRVYRLNREQWNYLTEILERRYQRYLQYQQPYASEGSPHPLDLNQTGGDPNPKISNELKDWLTPASLSDIRQLWKQANSPELIAELKAMIPEEAFKQAIA